MPHVGEFQQAPDVKPFSPPTAFSGGWVNYGAPFAPVGYYKDNNGFVHIKGLVKSGAGNTTIFTLPAGFCPADYEVFNCISDSGAVQVYVQPSGIVSVLTTGSAFLSLSGITFKTA